MKVTLESFQTAVTTDLLNNENEHNTQHQFSAYWVHILYGKVHIQLFNRTKITESSEVPLRCN